MSFVSDLIYHVISPYNFTRRGVILADSAIFVIVYSRDFEFFHVIPMIFMFVNSRDLELVHVIHEIFVVVNSRDFS
mgnify:CR=1 FL=1